LLFLGSATAALTSGLTFQQWILQLPLGLLIISIFGIVIAETAELYLGTGEGEVAVLLTAA